jgi:ATP-dependent Clp protease ATP-binding subunit ClpA
MEVKQPTRSQRKRMAQDMVGHLASKDLLERIAQSEHMSPAIMQRSGRVVSRLKDQLASTKGKSGKKGDALQSDDLESTLEMLLHNTLQAQGYRGLADNESDQASGLYDPAFTHADTDLARLAAGIRARPHARICLYGPPGTGKTAYGRWLAEQLDKPLHVKRASDLLGMYVGETEKRMALAFKDADEEGAVLLIDEVDSFLQDRSKAQRNWEISMVNEMLTQMERFKGVFIASTNLMDGLDQASLRRFDLKLKFDYLRPAQSRELFQRWCQKLGLKDVAHEAHKMVESLEVLTPGDFAALGRRHHFAPFESPSEVAAALVDGCNLKQIPLNRKVGFIH